MILIVTARTDTHADKVEAMLRQRGHTTLRFNPADFPARASLSMHTRPHQSPRWTLQTEQYTIALDEVHAVWYRRPEAPKASPQIQDEAARAAIEQDCVHLLNSLWESMDSVFVPARPMTMRRADLKSVQLDLAERLGFDIPPTLLTNAPQDFIRFHQEQDMRIISKPLDQGLMKHFGAQFLRYTELVPRRSLVHAQGVQQCPMAFQSYVDKHVELRITVVGQTVHAAEIDSQSSHHTRHDWRRYDLITTPHRRHDLPAHIAQQCVDLVEALGLRYGAIDMILKPDGSYVFLEINPNGQYLWIEELTGMPISDAICDLLSPEPAKTSPQHHLDMHTEALT